MPDAKYRVKVGDAEYIVTAPDANTAWQWANMTHAQAAPAQTPAVPAPAPTSTASGEEGNFLGRAVERGVPILRKGLAQIVEEAPEIAASLFSSLPGTNYLAPLAKGLGAAATQSETYKGLTGDMVAAERAAVEKQLADIGPRKYGGFFEEEGFGRKLGSLAETVAESAIPVGVGLATGLVTRSPTAAGIVMGAGSIPTTYGGIRERQEAEGIRNIDRAVFGTAVSSALDVLTGVGGKVLSGTSAIAAREILEAGLKQAAIRVVKSGGEEAGTEMLQNVVEQVAGGTDPFTKKAMLETLESGLAGALGGTVFTGATEVVAAPFRRTGDVTSEGVPVAPGIKQEFQRLAAQEVAAVMAANPGMDQKAAVEAVSERAEELLTKAAANVVARGEGGADVTSDAGAAVDVSGGVGAGAAPDLGAAPTGAGIPGAGEAVTGGLGEPVPSVSVPDVGARAGEPALTSAPVELPKITGAQIKATVPTIEQVFTDNQIDFEDSYGVKKLNAEQKKQAARIVLQSPEVDPYDAIGSVLERGQRLRGETVAPKVAPVTAPTAIDQELAARDQEVSQELLAPEVQTEPTVAETATVEKVAPPAQKTLNDLAGAGTVNPENTNEVLVEGGGIQLTPVGEDIVQLDSLRAVEKGGGRKAMQQLTKAADDNGTTIQLSPEPFAAEAGKQMSPTELIEWYKGFGFQEQPDGSMVRPATQAPSITPEPQYTPQQIAENLDRFAVSEAQDRGLDPGMFREGAVDIQRGREPLPDQQILEAQGQEALDAYKAGQQWAQERVAEAQAAPTQAAAKAAPARAPKKVKAVGTKGAKAKAVKAVIKRKPGKTAAEKVLNMAQAEVDAMPKEDMVEQVTPYDPEYETIRAKPGINATRMAKMLGPQLYGDPTNMGQVCIKEVLQNSFDATRTAVNEGQVEQGKIDIVVSDDGRKLTVKDNGIGMTPELLGGKFLEIAGTAKEGDQNAGGFGIAKMLFLYANKNIRVTTARDGRIAEMDVTGEQLFASLDDPNQAPDIEVRDFAGPDFMVFPDGHGTIIQLTIPEEAGDYKIKELPRWLDNVPALELSPLFSNIAVTFQGRSYMGSEDVKVGSNFPVEDYTQFVGVKFPWGTAKVYVTRNQTAQTYGENMHILSNGLWQFSTAVKKDPSDPWGPSVPYTFYVDIVPSVKPDQPGYPFNFNRQNFTDDAKMEFGKVKKYVDAIYAYKSRAGEATSFGSVQYFQPDGQLGPVIDLTPDIPVQDTAFTRIAEGDQITVGEGGALLVNGQPMPELTPEQLKAGIPSASDLTVSPDLIDTNAVMVHDNADVVINATGEKMSIPDYMRQRFGQRFDDFMRFNGDTFLTLRNEVARVMGYGGLRDEAIGVSFDPEYRGVSIRLPFSGSFINPLVPKYGDGLRAGYGIFGTMIHELAHHKVRSHNANFPAEMQDILLNMEADEGFAYQRFKDNFADTIAADYADIVQLGVELFNGRNPDITVEYRGNRFTEGSGEQAPEGTGAGGTGDVRGPSGAGSTGESVLGPSFERTGGTGAGRDTGAGAQGGTEPVTDANVDQVVSVKLTKAQIKRLEEAAGIRRMKLSNMQQRIVKSRNAEEALSLSGKLMLLARGQNDDVNLLTSLFNSVPPGLLQKLLGPMMTEDVVRLAERAGMENIPKIDAMIRNEYTPYINRLMHAAAAVSEKWADFASRFEEGNQALADVMYIANMYDVDPTLAASAAEYAKVDTKLIELATKLAAETDPKKKKALKGQITERRGEIQRVYYGGKLQDKNGKPVRDANNKPVIVYGWNDLSDAKMGGGAGKRIFRLARDHYRNTFEEHYRLLMERIDASKFENEKAVELKSAVDEMFAKARARSIYFPLKRFGEYWVSVGTGQNSEFHLFESLGDQKDFIDKIKAEGETRAISASSGKDTLRKQLHGKAADASVALRNILDKIEGDNITDVDILKDNIFQMYLMALPEADMRRRFIHREFKTGFSTDALRTFASTAVASASQLGRLAYNYKLNNLIEASKAETEGNPSKGRLDTLTREVAWRVESIMSPEMNGAFEWLVSVNSKGTFLFFLSGVKSALMNLTQLHIVGLPTLSAEFGEKATYGMAARYTAELATGKRIAVPFRDEDGNVRLEFPKFTAEDSAYIRGLQETDPDRYKAFLKAWEYAKDHDVTESTFSSGADIYERSDTPTGDFGAVQALRRGEVMTAAQRAAGNAINAMGGLFHSTERIGREIMYMSAFELAYERNLKEGMDPAAAGDAAMKQADKLTRSAMFDFTNWNKSRYSKAPVGRLALQMQSYSITMSSLLFRSFYGMLPYFNKEGKVASAKVFFGVGAMTALYGGFRVTQFTVLAMLGYGLLEFVKSLGDDEEDKEKEAAGDYLTDETIQKEMLKYADDKGRELSKKDMEYYIRATWIPETFGPGGTLAAKLGIGDAAAKKLEKVADIGLPGLFDVDLSSSVSLGDLFHPVETKATDPTARMFEMIGRRLTGPTGSMYGSFIKSWQQFNAGDIDKAIETGMPAMIRNFIKAQRLKEEGLVVGADRDVVLKDPSYYDTYKVAMQSLGFGDAETTRNMQLDIAATDIEKGVAAEATQLLSQRYRAARAYYLNPTPETAKEFQEAERAIKIYNLNYPSNEITEEDKQKSYASKSADAAQREGGLGYNPKIPVRQSEAERRAAELGQ